MPKKLHIYIDGACSGNPGPGGWAYVIVGTEETLYKKDSGGFMETTNNRMEIMAALKALRWLSTDPYQIGNVLSVESIIFYSDSEYLVEGFHRLSVWKQRNWRKTNKKQLLNVDLWQQLLAHTKALGNLEFVKVKGHDGVKYNELCDRLARNVISGSVETPVDETYFLTKNKEI